MSAPVRGLPVEREVAPGVEGGERAELRRLMARLADGDRAAFGPAFALLWPRLRAFAARYVAVADAEDAAQAALLRVFSRASEYDPERDALAWALTVAGRMEEAGTQMARALAEGTGDARLFFHAAVIAARAGRTEDATKWFTKAAAMMDLLLPSEQELLLKLPDSFARRDDETKADLPSSAATDLSASALAAEGK